MLGVKRLLYKEKLLTAVELIYLLGFQLLMQSLPQFINICRVLSMWQMFHMVLVIMTTQSAGYYGVTKVQKDCPWPKRSVQCVSGRECGECMCVLGVGRGEGHTYNNSTLTSICGKWLLRSSLITLMRGRIHSHLLGELHKKA